ncbi:MAG: hypothetical protein LBK59_11040 [Bifidobacteriaceae bacterium]|jgi:hypothetical protein|nr:hypothetical protein [Bifidobacteriaceae bacterium]
MKERSLAVMALTVALAVGMSSCSADDGDVAAIGKPSPSASYSKEEQAAATEGTVACLLDAGIPAQIGEYGFGIVGLEFDQEGHHYVYRAPGGSWNSGEDLDGLGISLARLEELASREGDYLLVVDGVDQTDIFETCLTDNGYREPPNPEQDPEYVAEQMAYARATADASDRWAACAREHGYPDLADVERPTDIDTGLLRAVLLPVDMAENQMATLLEDCPLYTEEDLATLRADPAAIVGKPIPGFNYSGFDGAAGGWEDSDPVAQRLLRIREIVEGHGRQQLRDAGIIDENDQMIVNGTTSPDNEE